VFAGSGDDTFYLANGDFAPGESLTGNGGTDSIILTNATTVDSSTGNIALNEILTGSSGDDTVTMTATQWANFTTIDLRGGTNTLTVIADGSDISALGTPTVTNVQFGNLVGDSGSNSITLTGAQLDAILVSSSIDLQGGTDTINLTSTSVMLNFH